MKLAIIINSLATGGAEKLIVDTAPRFEEFGIQVDVILLNGTSHPLKKQLEQRLSGKVISLGNKSVYSPMHIFSLAKHIKQYDMLHVHLFPALYWVAIAKILSSYKGRLLFTEHNISNRRFDKNWAKYIDRLIYKQYDRCIAITEPIRTIIGDRFNILHKTCLIENGVDVKVVTDAIPYSDAEMNTWSIENNKKLLIQVSAFRLQKDQITLIEAMKFLPSDVALLLVGEGENYEKCRKKANDINLESKVFFLGVRTDVPRLLKSADIIVLSSKYEGMSLSSIEGMASGRPFVASDVPGLSEIVAGAGVLFPQGDAKQLAKEINQLLDNQEYYNEVVEKCQERAASFDISTMVHKHIDLYESIYQA
mgnify:FL=1